MNVDYALIACLMEMTLPLTAGMIYTTLMFPSRYSPLQTFLFLTPQYIPMLICCFFIRHPLYFTIQMTLGMTTVPLFTYMAYRIFLTPTRRVCAYYFAYCMLSPYTIVSILYGLFSPYGNIFVADVQTQHDFGRYCLKMVFILLLSAVIIATVIFLSRHIHFPERPTRIVQILFNTAYIATLVAAEINFLMQSISYSHMFIITSVLAVSLFLVLKLIFDRIDLHSLRYQQTLLADQRALQYQCFTDYQSHENEIRKLRHDIMGHLQTLHALAQEKDCTRMGQYAAELRTQYQQSASQPLCSHDLVNMILLQRAALCKDHGITLDCRITADQWPAMREIDLISLFTLILDYHIQRCRAAKSAAYTITLSVQTQNDTLCLYCTDDSPVAYTRQPASLHLLEDLAARYQGSVKPAVDPNGTMLCIPPCMDNTG